MTPEQKEPLIAEIQARHGMTAFAFEGQEPPQAQKDIGLLLSLVKSQESEAWETQAEIRELRARHERRNEHDIRAEDRATEMVKDAAVSMRSRCVEKVKAMPDHSALCGVWLQQVCDCSFRAEAIKALESVSIQEQNNRERCNRER